MLNSFENTWANYNENGADGGEWNERRSKAVGLGEYDYETFFMRDHRELEMEVAGLISSISVLKHQHNTEEETLILRDCIPMYFNHLDKMNATYRFQNACAYIAGKYDVRDYYMRTLIIKAVEHAGGYENIFQRVDK